MAQVQLTAEARSQFGKGASRRLRRAGKTPAVLYGHGTDPVHVALPEHALMMALKQSNALFEITLDGKSQLAVAKDVQRSAVRHDIEHVDLLIVKQGEKIVVSVPVVVTGESAAGTIHLVELQNIEIEALATALPNEIEVSIAGFEAGQHILAGDIALPAGSTLAGDSDTVVVVVSSPAAAEAAENADDENASGETAGEA